MSDEPKLHCPDPECAKDSKFRRPGGWGFEVGIIRFSSMRVMPDLSLDHAFMAHGPMISVECGNCGRRVEASVETIEALLAIQLPKDEDEATDGR